MSDLVQRGDTIRYIADRPHSIKPKEESTRNIDCYRVLDWLNEAL
jgi:hypothetical protein